MSNVKLFECFGVFDRHDIGQSGFVDLRFDHYSNNPGMPSLYPYHTISIKFVMFKLVNKIPVKTKNVLSHLRYSFIKIICPENNGRGY